MLAQAVTAGSSSESAGASASTSARTPSGIGTLGPLWPMSTFPRTGMSRSPNTFSRSVPGPRWSQRRSRRRPSPRSGRGRPRTAARAGRSRPKPSRSRPPPRTGWRRRTAPGSARTAWPAPGSGGSATRRSAIPGHGPNASIPTSCPVAGDPVRDRSSALGGRCHGAPFGAPRRSRSTRRNRT
jgi:hypothetical protein